MPLVLYTNEPFQPGSVVDTRDYCDLNRRALDEATRDEQEVEAFLEEVREEYFKDAPDRLCSVVGVPIPKMSGFALRENKGKPGWSDYRGHVPTPEPPGIGRYCYHIAKGLGSRHLTADETFVKKLVEQWGRSRNESRQLDLARSYWNSDFFFEYSFLIQGPIQIVDVCHSPQGGERLKPLLWDAD